MLKKIQDSEFWPEGTRTRPYKPPTARRKSGLVNRRGNNETRDIPQVVPPGTSLGNPNTSPATSQTGNLNAMHHSNVNGSNLMPGVEWRQMVTGNFAQQNPARGIFDNAYLPVSMGRGNMNIAPGSRNILQPSQFVQAPVLSNWPVQNSTPVMNSLYVPSSQPQKQVRILDRVGADTFSQQY